MFRAVMLITIFTISSLAAASGDEGLYEDVAPPGSTFIRILNADGEGISDITALGTSKIADLEACQASAYYFLPAGKAAVSVGKISEQFIFSEKQFYTAVYKKGSIILHEDTYFTNRRKALISVYNLLLDAEVDLTAKAGAVKVIEGVAVGTKKDREINAVKIAMEVFSSGEQIIGPSVQSLTRGDVYSAFVCGNKSKASVSWQKWDVQSLPASS